MRADMDSLPVLGESGVANMSKVHGQGPQGQFSVTGVHACGHDVHITSLVGTARQMAARRESL